MSHPGTIPPKKEGLVTMQEWAGLGLISLGVLGLAVAAYAYWGWPALLAVLSCYAIVAGFFVGTVSDEQ